MNEIEKFFLPPCPVQELPEELIASGERPVLHLLRRDLEELYLKESFFRSEVGNKHRAPYLAAMGVFTGLDLMAKFYGGKGRSGDIFKKFFIEVCEQSQEEADFAWELRNAIHHSYSLSLKYRKNTIFSSKADVAAWHEKIDGIHHVNLWGLKRFFLDATEKFKTLILANDSLKSKFIKKYKSAGRIFVLKTEKSSDAVGS